MARRSRKLLESDVNRLERLLALSESTTEQILNAEDSATRVLRDLGYKFTAHLAEGGLAVARYMLGGTYHGPRYEKTWALTPAAVAKQRFEAEKAAAVHEADIQAAAENAAELARTETLQAVIEALELKEYGYRRAGCPLIAALSSGGFISGDKPNYPAELWSDIQTTLRRRKEAATDATNKAAEGRIADITKDQVRVGDRIAFYVPKECAESIAEAPTEPVAKPSSRKKAAKK